MNSLSIEYGDTGEFMASLGRDDEPTDRVSLRLLPSLEEVEAAVGRGPVSVAYYDPHADHREPWLWLQTDNPNWGPLRIYHACGMLELQKIINRFGRWYS